MRRIHLQHLACPICRSELDLSRVDVGDEMQLIDGTLRCVGCQRETEVRAGVPRFVPRTNGDSFGFQWRQHATTQHDSSSGLSISRDRFFQETRWPERLDGQVVLEVGCGAGRFTAAALETGATVIAVDVSEAVDVNYELHHQHPNLLVVQADLQQLPVRLQSVDRLFCFGVLQHTEQVEQSFKRLPEYVKPGGELSVDVYDRRTGLPGLVEPFYRTYYWLRPITRRMPPETLYRIVRRYVLTVWPITRQIAKVPACGRTLNRMLLIHDYRRRYDLSESQLQEWAILDAFDNLAPRYDQRQTIETVRRWFRECRLEKIDVHFGFNGIEGRATKC